MKQPTCASTQLFATEIVGARVDSFRSTIAMMTHEPEKSVELKNYNESFHIGSAICSMFYSEWHVA